VRQNDTSREIVPTRRRFLKAGALLAAPIAAASVCAVAVADEDLKARIQRLEDEAAIRELHQSWVRRVNAGERDVVLDSAVRRITAHHSGAPDKIQVAADGRSAVGYFDSAVEAETPLAEDCTLAQMAHAQGNGTLFRTERRLLTVEYTKSGGCWNIAKVASGISDAPGL
jgi:hypothetical protein